MISFNLIKILVLTIVLLSNVSAETIHVIEDHEVELHPDLHDSDLYQSSVTEEVSHHDDFEAHTSGEDEGFYHQDPTFSVSFDDAHHMTETHKDLQSPSSTASESKVEQKKNVLNEKLNVAKEPAQNKKISATNSQIVIESKPIFEKVQRECKEYSYTKPCGYFTFLGYFFERCRSVRVCSKYVGTL